MKNVLILTATAGLVALTLVASGHQGAKPAKITATVNQGDPWPHCPPICAPVPPAPIPDALKNKR